MKRACYRPLLPLHALRLAPFASSRWRYFLRTKSRTRRLHRAMPRQPAADIEKDIEALDRAREARYAARAAAAAEKAQGTCLERAKLAALKEVAAKNPGGSLPGFLEKVGAKMGAKFERPPINLDASEPSPPPITEPIVAMPLSLYRHHQQHLFTDCSDIMEPRESDAAVRTALFAADTLGCIVNFAGLRSFATVSLVCREWRDAVDAKAREWGYLICVCFPLHMRSNSGGREGLIQTDPISAPCTRPVLTIRK